MSLRSCERCTRPVPIAVDGPIDSTPAHFRAPSAFASSVERFTISTSTPIPPMPTIPLRTPTLPRTDVCAITLRTFAGARGTSFRHPARLGLTVLPAWAGAAATAVITAIATSAVLPGATTAGRTAPAAPAVRPPQSRDSSDLARARRSAVLPPAKLTCRWFRADNLSN